MLLSDSEAYCREGSHRLEVAICPTGWRTSQYVGQLISRSEEMFHSVESGNAEDGANDNNIRFVFDVFTVSNYVDCCLRVFFTEAAYVDVV